MRSYLSRHQPRTPTPDDEIRALRRRTWLEQKIAVLPLAEIQNDWDRQHVINLATKLYGAPK